MKIADIVSPLLIYYDIWYMPGNLTNQKNSNPLAAKNVLFNFKQETIYFQQNYNLVTYGIMSYKYKQASWWIDNMWNEDN